MAAGIECKSGDAEGLGMTLKAGIIIDIETTGLNCEVDRIIEVGILKFLLEDGEVPVVVEAYSGTEDPGVALSEEIRVLTGLSDGVLAGSRIEWATVKRLMVEASILVAHNAAFDRSFLLKRPELQPLTGRFACSQRHIDWKGKGFDSAKLTYLAADHGFVNPFPHRALFDCATTLRIVAPHMDELIRRSLEREFIISAWDSPFETKDVLKSRGYRWDSQKRVWQRLLGESALGDERSFLQQAVYKKGDLRHQEELCSD